MMRFLPKLQIALRQVSVFVLLLCSTVAASQTYSWTSGTTWLGGTWSPAGPPSGSTAEALFDNNTNNLSIGINMNSASTAQKNIGAVHFGTGATSARTINNNAGSTNGTLTLNGLTINSIANTIIRNAGSGTHTFANGTSTLSIGLGNATDNVIAIDGTGGITISAGITGVGRKLTKAGTGSGVLTLSGGVSNSYGGGTTISSGTLTCGAALTLPLGGTINMNGGTLRSGVTTGFAQSTGTLTLSENSTLALGTGAHNFNFSASNSVSWTAGKTLTITGWTGSPGVSGTSGKIFVGTTSGGLTAGQLGQITFSGFTNGTTILSTGEIVPAALAPVVSTATGGLWSAGTSWVGGVAPTANDNVSIVSGATITYDGAAATRNSGTTTVVASGAILELNASYANGGTTTVNGTLQVNAGGYASGNAFVYAATGTTLIMNNTGGLYGISTGQAFWPSVNPPLNVTIQGSGAQINNAVGSVAGTLTVSSQLVSNTGGGVTITTTGTAIVAAELNNAASGNVVVNGVLQINGGGFVSANAPTYGSASTLRYNSVYGVNTEWTGNATTAGIGVPFNVTIQNGAVTLNANRGMAGSLAITAGGSLILNGDLSLAGNWSNAGGFTPNSKAVFFNGSGAQSIANASGETFAYLVVNKSGGTLTLQNNVTVSGAVGGALQLLNTGAFDINGKTVTFSNAGGEIQTNGARTIASGTAGGVLAITGSKSVTGTGTLVVAANITSILSAGMNFGANKTTINGTLQINAGGFVDTNGPRYASGSILRYNVNAVFGRTAEWTVNTGTLGTTPGYPYDVVLTNNTILNAPNTANFGADPSTTALGLANNLTIDAGSALYMDYGGNGNKSGSLTVGKNLVLSGNLSLGNASGGDMFIGGNWTRTGTFTPNGRLVTFNGTTGQTMTGVTTFDYLTLNNSTGLTLASNAIVNQNLVLTSGKITLGANTLAVTGSITSNATNYIVTNGVGLLKRSAVGNTPTLFPVGNSATSYTPLTITNTGTVNDLSVGSSSSISNAVSDPTRIVGIQWTVASAGAGAATNIVYNWNTSNQGVNYAASGTGDLGVYTTGPLYAITPIGTMAGQTKTVNGVALASGNNLMVIGNTGAIYTASPPNDNCAGATSLVIGGGPITDNFLGSTPMTGATNNDLFYTFTPLATGNYTITINNFSVAGDRDFYVYAPCPADYNDATVVNGAGTSTTSEVVTANFTANTPYKILVEDYAALGGTFQIQVVSLVPTISSYPATACAGSSIVINGTNFTGATSVTIGGTNAPITNTTATTLTVTVGNGTTGNLVVTTPNGVATGATPITVNPLPTTAWAATATTVCGSTSSQITTLNYTATTNSPTTYSITWNPSPANSFAPVTDAAFAGTPGGGSINITVPANTNAGTYTGTIKVKNANGCQSSATQTFTITVNAAPPVTTGVTICAGGSASLTATASCPGVAQTPQTASGTGGTSEATTYGGAGNTNISINFPALPVGATVTNTVTTISYTSNGASWRSELRVRATPPAAVGAAQSDIQPSALGSAGNVSNAAFGTWGTGNPAGTWLFEFRETTNDGTPNPDANITNITITVNYTLPGTIQWFTASSGGSSIGSGSPFNPVGAPTSGLTDTTVPGTYTFYAACSSNDTCRTPANFTIEAPSVAGAVSANQQICSGTQPADITIGASTGAIQWQSSTDNIIYTDLSGQTSNTLAGATIGALSSTRYFKASVTNGTCPPVTSAVVTISIKAAVAISGVTADENLICSTATTTIHAVGVSGDGAVVTWYTDPNASGTNVGSGVDLAGVNPGTYYAHVTGDCGTVEASVTIDSKINVGIASAVADNNTLCSGETANLTANGVVGDGATVTWYGGPNATGTNYGSGLTLSNVAAGTYYAQVTGDCGGPVETSVTVSIGATTTWDGTSWNNGTPTSGMTAVIAGNYSEAANLNACSLTVNNNAVVSIPSGFDVTLNGSLTVSSGSFTLQNNANLLQNTNAGNSGNIIVRRNSSAIMRSDYTLWSSPVAGQNLQAFSPLTVVTPTSRFYQYNSATNLYNSIASPWAVTFADAKGYLIRVANNHPTTPTVWAGQFSGVPHNGNYSYPMFNGGAGLRFNLVGNPYPSPISAVAFTAANSANITKTLYFWRETNNNTSNNAYCTWSPAGGGNGTFVSNGEAQVFNPQGVIQTGQGFFVEAINAANQVDFTNAMRLANHANQFFRHALSETPQGQTSRIWLNVTSASGAFCQTAFGYMEDAGNGYDLGVDGRYINDGDTELYSIIDTERYAIQGRALPFVTTDTVPLGFKATLAGNYTIAIDHLDGLFAEGQSVFLKDNLTGATHDLATAYNFTSDAGTFPTRFEIVYQPALGVSNPSLENQVTIIKENGGFAISSGSATMDNIKVYDIAGRLLLEKKAIGSNAARFTVGQSNQVLVVKITSDENKTVIRKVVN